MEGLGAASTQPHVLWGLLPMRGGVPPVPVLPLPSHKVFPFSQSACCLVWSLRAGGPVGLWLLGSVPQTVQHTGVRLQRGGSTEAKGRLHSPWVSHWRLAAELQGGRDGAGSCLHGRTCFAQACRGWTDSRLRSRY